jgi:hypothetical protein|eukprot:TRINITY_DN48189_c0_g1_i1.p1 TRINITY_DN48189_c0_g1~~TRINITY_DN48189_c0_g1_i1.p1  ORF type:complete len:2002 (-),score=444.07 TRINITY_DN48189_c0_g1_i1:211-6153(-)
MASRGGAPQGWRPQQVAQLKRPTPPAAQISQPLVKKPTPPAGNFVVFSTAEKDEIGIRTLVGEYAEGGTNHGRKYYKKIQKIAGHENVDVYLYFWDERDGKAFSGWWFGNQVGGAQVWSRNKQPSATPPKNGWTIPWDGEVKPDLLCMSATEKQMLDQNESKVQQQKRVQEEALKTDEKVSADWEDRVQQATERAAEAEVDTETAIENAKVAIESGDETEIAKAIAELAKQAAALAETQRSIAVEGLAAQKAPPALKAEMVALGQRIRKVQSTLKEEQNALKSHSLTQVKQPQDDDDVAAPMDERTRQLEAQHTRQLEEILPIVMEKVDSAEDEVEKAAIAAAPLNIDTADDLRPVMLGAIKETEQRCRAAQASIGEARRFISGKIAQAQRFVASAKRTALEEFQGLQTRLNEAQEKLNPFKTVRQDYEQRVQAKKLYEELSSKLAGAEIEVEKAAMMTAPLGGDSIEGMKETETALTAAQSALSQTSRLIEAKLRTAEKGAVASEALEDVRALQERARSSQEKLDEVRKTMKETQVRVAADNLLKDVSEKVSNAEDELQRMAEAELPFLRGDQKGEDLDQLIEEADKVAEKVHLAIGEAQTFVARKLVEVARFTEGPARAVREEIDMLQKRLEEGRGRLKQFQAGTADRKRSHIFAEIEGKVSAAESEVSKMTEATAALTTVGTVGETVSDGLKETVEQANLCERAAQAAIVVARKHLITKTAELKKLPISNAGAGAELGKLQTRVNNMQQEITKLRNATKDAEERVRVKQMLAEVVVRLQAGEAEVDKVASAAVPLRDASATPEQVERTEKATAAAQTKLSATAKLVDVKLKSAQGFLKDELNGMRARITHAEAKLSSVIRASKEQKEKLEASELIAQAVEKVESAEVAVQRTSQAELPFLKGIEVLDAKDAQKAVAESEKSAATAQKAVSEARTFIVQKLTAAKQFSSNVSEGSTRELLGLQKKLDSSAAKLAEMKKDTAERKRRTQMQASGEKVANVEAALKTLIAEMEKFADDRLAEISADDARTVCEDIAAAEQAAQSSVSEARKFLAARTQEAKSLPESQRSSATADLSKLQTRLTQCQVELAKLTKQCTEREQRFVAQKLVQDAQTSLDKIQADAQAAGQSAEPLFGQDQILTFLNGLRLQSLIESFNAYMKKLNASFSDLFESAAGGKGKNTIASEAFVAFVDKISELGGCDGASFTEEQAAALFKTISGNGKSISLDDFRALLRERYICTQATALSDAVVDGNEVGTIEVGEGIEILEKSEGQNGITRVHCLLARTGASVWTTLQGADGPNFRQSSTVAGKMESIEACVSSVFSRCAELVEFTEEKTTEVSRVKQGPLAEIKNKLFQIHATLSQEHTSMEHLRKRVLAAKVLITQKRKEEIQGVQGIKIKAMTSKALKDATDAVSAAEEKATKVIESAKSGSAEKLQSELSMKQLTALKDSADEALRVLAHAKGACTKVTERFDAHQGSNRNLLLESRVELTKLTSRVTTAERKCRAATEAVRTALEQVVKAAAKKARSAIQASARNSSKTYDTLFGQISGGKAEITEAQFSAFIKKIPSHGMNADQMSMAFKDFGPFGLRKANFVKALQEFCSCARSIAITDSFSLESSSTVRKLEAGEVFEILEGPQEDQEAQISRVRGRALRDGVVGWVTVQGNQGTPFLKASEKPFLTTTETLPLQSEIPTSSKTVKQLGVDEVLELLEGPREHVPGAELFLQGTASSDRKEGWITLRESDGAIAAAPNKDLFVCRSTIAMTNEFDIKKCQVVRKVDVGEALQVVGGRDAKVDSDVEITRLRFKALRDGKEGWISLKGNQGTVFVEASGSHYTVTHDTILRDASSRESSEVRVLKAGEAFEAKGEPEEDRPKSRLVMKARSIDCGSDGWLSFEMGTAPSLRPWKPRYVVRASVALSESLAGDDVIRKAEPGESFDVVEGPTLDKAGLRRVRCAKGGVVVGWAMLRNSEGDLLLECS